MDLENLRRRVNDSMELSSKETEQLQKVIDYYDERTENSLKEYVMGVDCASVSDSYTVELLKRIKSGESEILLRKTAKTEEELREMVDSLSKFFDAEIYEKPKRK